MINFAVSFENAVHACGLRVRKVEEVRCPDSICAGSIRVRYYKLICSVISCNISIYV